MLLAGGIYHVYDRVFRGEGSFRNKAQTDRLEAASVHRLRMLPGTDFPVLEDAQQPNLGIERHLPDLVEHTVWEEMESKNEE